MSSKIITLSSNAGLPNEQIHAISEDSKGRLWLAGPAGAMCYNGHDVRTFDTRDGLECPGLRTIRVHEEEVWLGTDRGIERLQIGGEIKPIEIDFEWHYGIAECFLFIDKEIYVGTSSGLLVLDKTLDRIQLKQHYDIGLVTSLLAFNGSVLAICSTVGLVRISNGTFEDIVLSNDECNPYVLHQTIDNALLVGTDNGLFTLDESGEITSKYTRESGNQSVTSIQSKGSTVFVAFGNTLHTLDREVSGFFEISDPTKFSSRINDLHVDGLDNIWVATNNSGISKISALNNVIYPVEHSTAKAVFCITPNDTELLIGGDGFCNNINLKTLESAQIKDSFDFNSIVWDICVDPNDKELTWYATEEGIFLKKQGSQPKFANSINHIVRGPNRCLQVRDDKIFVGTISGLYKITADRSCEEVLNSEGLSFGYVYSLSLNNQNEFWVATLGQGLWKETNTVFAQICDDNLSSKGNTYAALTNQADQTLVMQQENILIINKDLSSQIILKEYPLGGWTGCWINAQLVAIGSSDGICIVDVREKQIKHRINLFLDRSEWQFTSSRSLVYSGEFNTLFAGLNSGAYVIDLERLNQYTIPPTIHLNQLIWKNAEVCEENGIISLESGRWYGQVQVFCDWFVDEKTVLYRFKIKGFDDSWTDLSALNTLHFNSLPIGEYEILGQAFTPLSNFGEIKTLCRLNVTGQRSVPFKKAVNFLNRVRKNADQKKSITQSLITQNESYQQELEERKRVEKELKSYRVQLEDLVNKRTEELYLEKERAVSADKLKTVFLATMSHEIRTPLGGIIGLNNLMKETDLTEEQEAYIAKIDFSSQYLLQTINDILDITKIESDSLELESIEFSIHQLIEEIVELVNLRVGNKVHFLLDKKISLTKLIVGDPLRIKQVLVNLVGNAIKFTHDGHITLRIKQVGESTDQTSILFSVADTGIGMDKKKRDYLFVPFSQGDTSITRKYSGTGLGLSISRKFIHLMGSEINVTSEEDVGSEFSFTLAFKTSQEDDSNLLKDQFNFNLNNQRVAIVDHYKPSFELLEELLLAYKFEVSDADLPSQEVLKNNDLVIVNLATLKSKSEILRLLKSKPIKKYKSKILLLHDVNEADNKILKPLFKHLAPVPLSQSKFVASMSNLLNKKLGKVDKIIEPKQPVVTVFSEEKHLLVAEDNELNQLIIKKVLNNYGFKVTVTNNGVECVEALRADNDFELLFMDIHMPEMDGIQATKLIRTELKNDTIPIVALTADVTVETKTKVMEYGMNDYLSKPIVTSELVRVINAWLKN